MSICTTHPAKGETMQVQIERTKENRLRLTVNAENEVETIALERWIDENEGAAYPGLRLITTAPGV